MPYLSEPGALTGAVAEFADEQHREEFRIRELVFAGTAAAARRVGTAEARLHPIIHETVDDQEQVVAAKGTG
jgi:hypothetical protein